MQDADKLVPLLEVLTAACQNDHNCKTVASFKAALQDSGVDHAHQALRKHGPAVDAAAITLLHTVSTNQEALQCMVISLLSGGYPTLMDVVLSAQPGKFACLDGTSS